MAKKRRYWAMPTIGSFFLCGLAHTLIVVPFMGRWASSVIVAFTFFGLVTVLSRRLAPLLRQDQWPAVFNVLVNAGLVAGGFDLGFRFDDFINSRGMLT